MCIRDRIYTVNGLYKLLIVCCLVYSVLGMSIFILISVIEPKAINMLYSADHLVQYTFIPLCVSMYLRNQFQRICLTVHSLYYRNNFKKSLKSTSSDALNYNWRSSDKIIDCGYFKMKWTLLSITFNFVPLFVFSMLPQLK